MLMAGTTVSGYRIEGLLGEGGMATVYEANQTSLDRVIALKVLAQRLGDDPSFRERFRRESHVQALLEHPNIVPIIEAGESEHGLWLAMRLVRGPTLREVLKKEKLSPSKTLRLLAPIARAMDAAHERGLIHRDITPQNILIDEREHPYLSDFGITKGPEERSLTRTGQFVGTLDYVAPEQIRDEPSTAATDTYALAAIMFECLTGQVPFEKKTEAAVLYAHIAEDPSAASSVEASLPKKIDSVLAKGLAKQQRERYESATELIEAAERALRKPSTERQVVPPRSGRPPLRRFLRAPAIAAVLLLGLVSLGFGALTGDHSDADSKRVVAGDLAVDLPSGGLVAGRGRSNIADLPLIGAAILRPRVGGSGESVTVGLSPATGKTLLPPALARGAVGSASGKPVSLQPLQALRYLGLRSSGPSPIAVFAAPASGGVATLACRPYRRGSDFARLCQQLASTLELVRGRAFPLGPSPELAAALRHRLGALNESRRVLRRRLASAGSSKLQARFASQLATAFRGAAHGLVALDITPQSAGALARLVGALRSTRDAYRNLAGAARREDVLGYDSAVVEVKEGEKAVDRRLVALRALGYKVGGPG